MTEIAEAIAKSLSTCSEAIDKAFNTSRVAQFLGTPRNAYIVASVLLTIMALFDSATDWANAAIFYIDYRTVNDREELAKKAQKWCGTDMEPTTTPDDWTKIENTAESKTSTLSDGLFVFTCFGFLAMIYRLWLRWASTPPTDDVSYFIKPDGNDVQFGSQGSTSSTVAAESEMKGSSREPNDVLYRNQGSTSSAVAEWETKGSSREPNDVLYRSQGSAFSAVAEWETRGSSREPNDVLYRSQGSTSSAVAEWETRGSSKEPNDVLYRSQGSTSSAAPVLPVETEGSNGLCCGHVHFLNCECTGNLGKLTQTSPFMEDRRVVFSEVLTLLLEDAPLTWINLNIISNTCQKDQGVNGALLATSLGSMISSFFVVWYFSLHFAYSIKLLRQYCPCFQHFKNAIKEQTQGKDEWSYKKKAYLYPWIVLITSFVLTAIFSLALTLAMFVVVMFALECACSIIRRADKMEHASLCDFLSCTCCDDDLLDYKEATGQATWRQNFLAGLFYVFVQKPGETLRLVVMYIAIITFICNLWIVFHYWNAASVPNPPLRGFDH